jgi:hypothetical protein
MADTIHGLAKRHLMERYLDFLVRGDIQAMGMHIGASEQSCEHIRYRADVLEIEELWRLIEGPNRIIEKNAGEYVQTPCPHAIGLLV